MVASRLQEIVLQLEGGEVLGGDAAVEQITDASLLHRPGEHRHCSVVHAFGRRRKISDGGQAHQRVRVGAHCLQSSYQLLCFLRGGQQLPVLTCKDICKVDPKKSQHVFPKQAEKLTFEQIKVLQVIR